MMQSHTTADDGVAFAYRRHDSLTASLHSFARRAVRAVVIDLWRVPLTAHSCTMDTDEGTPLIDFFMPATPLRAWLWLTLCPLLCYPVAFVYTIGYYRCLRTTRGPFYKCTTTTTTTTTTTPDAATAASTSATTSNRSASSLQALADTVTSLACCSVNYCVQRRNYHPQRRELSETAVLNAFEIRHAMKVTAGERMRFIDDPTQPHVAYYVCEQPVINTFGRGGLFMWQLSLLSDMCRYVVPVLLASVYLPAHHRLLIDLRLCYEGRLRLSQVRHPITNFFETAAEYRRSRHRVNVTLRRTRSTWL